VSVGGPRGEGQVDDVREGSAERDFGVSWHALSYPRVMGRKERGEC